MNKHRCYQAGPLSGCRNEWMLLLIELRQRAFGIFWQRTAGELSLILGCRVLERSALGYPRSFCGGLHLKLQLSLPFPITAASGNFGRIFRRPG